MTELSGANIVAGRERRGGSETFTAVNPYTGQAGDVEFVSATDEEVADALAAASEAFRIWRSASATRRAEVLRAAAHELEEVGEELAETGDAETGLGRARLQQELTRTAGQLRFFGDVLDEGSYLEAIIDLADPDAKPIARPDLRRMLIPMGPVVVFAVSNFPLAFSVPGGDTASALAAGCPVIVKAHRSHPGTSELAARAITRAVAACDAPPGLFSMLHGGGRTVGATLVKAPEIAAVGFTGSVSGGRALFDQAAARPTPIPVYAEMSSLNPVFLTEGAVAARHKDIAEGFFASMTQGSGQFCTKPGLVFLPEGDAGQAFVDAVVALAGGHEPGALLNERVQEDLSERMEETDGLPGVEILAGGRAPGGAGFRWPPTVLSTTLETFLDTPGLIEEYFGPVSVLVRCKSAGQMVQACEQLTGNLTATVHAEAHELDDIAELQAALREKAGRLVHNGYPTGVAVSYAQHHGGPYPATSIPMYTSVGGTAIKRWLRPVAYQDTPQELLPEALRDDNPLGIHRLVNSRWTDQRLGR